jgi:hypothetical protein
MSIPDTISTEVVVESPLQLHGTSSGGRPGQLSDPRRPERGGRSEISSEPLEMAQFPDDPGPNHQAPERLSYHPLHGQLDESAAREARIEALSGQPSNGKIPNGPFMSNRLAEEPANPDGSEEAVAGRNEVEIPSEGISTTDTQPRPFQRWAKMKSGDSCLANNE